MRACERDEKEEKVRKIKAIGKERRRQRERTIIRENWQPVQRRLEQ